MNDSYFIRVRGKVQGPFEAEKLRQLARRGQFSRMHEVSTDSQSWQPAKDYPQLFSSPAASEAPTQPRETFSSASTSPSASPSPVNSTNGNAPPRNDIWYYAQGGNHIGPIDFVRLSNLFSTGQLAPDIAVWREGMSDWAPASTISGLVLSPTSTKSVEVEREVKSASQIDPSIARVLGESRGWLIFLSVMVFLYAASMLIGGIFQLTAGARLSNMPLTAIGLTQMILSFVVAFAGYLLMSFVSRIATFERTRAVSSLLAALTTLRSFWVYLGILLIVVLVLITIFVVIVVSTIGSFPNVPSDWS